MMNLTGKHIIATLGLLLSVLTVTAQGKLKGTLTDSETGQPLIGATVQIVGTYKGTSADVDGKYMIKDIKPGDYSIKISFIGFAAKVFNGITIKDGETTELDASLEPRSQTLQEVTIVGEANLVDLESGKSEVSIGQEDIEEMNVRDVKEVVSMQAGVNTTTDGIQIRGGRVYETEYLIDGISAQDPLAGSGSGAEVSANAAADVTVITGGQGAEFGGSSAGVISTKIREGGDKFQIGGSWQRDNLGFDKDNAYSWNTDIIELNMGGPVPGTKKKVKFFTAIQSIMSDNYFGPTANQLESSILRTGFNRSGNDWLNNNFVDPLNQGTFWAPRQRNNWSHTLKLSWQIKEGTRLSVTNQHSLNINQNTRTLQIVGFDAILLPGFQFRRSLNLDNATTYTHHSNLTALNFNHFLNDKWNLDVSVGRLFTNLRADANGRPFRTETVDQILDEQSIITDPVQLYNPGDEIVYTIPSPWLINNGGISSLWHDHYAEEYTLKYKFRFYPNSKIHKITFGHEHKFTGYQWVDVTRPWVGAPIRIDENTTTPNRSIGSSFDIWSVNAMNGGLFAQDVITYKGIIATLGMRLNYWAPGKFADDAVDNPNSPVVDQVRQNYEEETFGLFGQRWKARLLPRINVSFPVTENNVLYFNYSHSMRLPHPRFVYQGLDPNFQDRSFLSNLGNPNINPEVNVSYEVGMKSQLTKDLAFTLSAFNNNRFDYIVSRRVLVEDQTGRPVSKQMYINQDYAKIQGVELGVFLRIGEHFKAFANGTYQVARGKSNSAREAGLQIEQNGEVELTREQYLAFDRPWNFNGGVTFSPDSTLKLWGYSLGGWRVFLKQSYRSGYRYTPVEQVGTNDLGRPIYAPNNDEYLQEIGTPWISTDIKLSKTFYFNNKSKTGITLSIELRNALNNKRSQIVNPVTGTAYRQGDPVTNNYRDPRYLGPQETGALPNNPARFLPPRQLLYGISFKF